MKRRDFEMMASSIAFPTLSSRSSSRSCLACSRTWASAPDQTGQEVVRVRTRSRTLLPLSRRMRIARSSQRAARVTERGPFVRLLSARKKWILFRRKAKTTDLFPAR